jgi:SAM-dependent methyltransferase
MSDFDPVAAEYDEQLNRGLKATGEGREYFATGRVRHLATVVASLGEVPSRVLDYGCGSGQSVTLLRSLVGADDVVGVDDSVEQVARARLQDVVLRTAALRPDRSFDLVYCNGVLHHVALEERPRVLAKIRGYLRPKGLFALFENNPFNPGTRYVMSRIPFDRDAIPLTPRESRLLVTAAGFRVLRVDFLFFFPRPLHVFRLFEPLLKSVPLGGQYLVLAKAEE